jgi:hypothetical protein
VRGGLLMMAGPLNPPFLNAPSGYILGDFEICQ